MAQALLKTTLKRCGCCSLLPPKDILRHCAMSVLVTSTDTVLLQTWRKPFTGTGAPKQLVALVLQASCTGWALAPVESPRCQQPQCDNAQSTTFLQQFERIASECDPSLHIYRYGEWNTHNTNRVLEDL